MIDRQWAEHAAETLERLRERAPLVHNITNYVAMDLAANALNALGASPVMAHAEEEAGEFAEQAAALTINIGTLSTPWIKGIKAAVQAAMESDTPWVFDPVGVGATRYRNEIAEALSGLSPAVIRANASEVQALAGLGDGGKGVDSTADTDDAIEAAKELATRLDTVVLMTGVRDIATNGETTMAVDHGHELMGRITASGCALTALCGAFLAVEPEPLAAAVAAATCFGLAGDLAAMDAEGPGSFRVSLLDQLYALEPDIVAERGTIKPL